MTEGRRTARGAGVVAHHCCRDGVRSDGIRARDQDSGADQSQSSHPGTFPARDAFNAIDDGQIDGAGGGQVGDNVRDAVSRVATGGGVHLLRRAARAAAPAVPIVLGSKERVYRFWQALLKQNIFTVMSIAPAVPPGKDLVRTAVSAMHSDEDLDRIGEAMAKAVKNL